MDAIFAFAADRRTCRRHRVLKEGKIIIAGQTGELPVWIRNLSATGAGLTLNRPQQVPAEFDLLLVTESLLFRASLRWRRGEYVGVEFAGEPRHVTST